jgi:predicted ATPase
MLSQFDDGVFFVDLAPLSDHAQVPSVIIRTLGMTEQPGRELIDTLVDGVAPKDLLLVLDNVEHVLPAAWVAERLLAAAPRLRILATSRAPLRLYGEQEQQVPPLELPDLGQPYELEAVSRNEALALFTDRAQAASPAFVLTDQNARFVADVCARLDGLPLAIELAASWTKVLTPQGILSRLATGPDVLIATARNLPPRQRTLRATIDWSCALLTDPQRRLFARLAVFRGGAALDAVEAVGNPGGDLGVDTLEALSSLVDNSLVRQTELPDSEPRFAMLETIREYGGEQLATTGDAAPTRQRHAQHFLALAEEGEPHLTTPDQVPWLDRFEREHDNFQAAFQWTTEAGELERGLGAAAAMWRFWLQRGHLSAGRIWLERLLHSAGEHHTTVVAKAHLAAAGIAFWQGDYDAAHRQSQKGLAVSQALDDRPGVAEATYNLAFVSPAVGLAAGELDWLPESIKQLRDAMTRFEELDDRAGVAKSKGAMALFLAGVGDFESARPLFEEAIAGCRDLGDMFHLANILGEYGYGLQMLGHHQEARAPILESLGLFHRAGNLMGVGLALEALAALELAEGRHERAIRLLGRLGRSDEVQRVDTRSAPPPSSGSMPWPRRGT